MAPNNNDDAAFIAIIEPGQRSESMPMRTLPSMIVLGSLLLLSLEAPAQPGDALRDAVQKAVATHPDVTARFNAFRAATEEIGVVEGGFYPRVDLSADMVANKDRITTRAQPDSAFGQRGVTLSVSQLLWDGLTTRHEVERLGHARLTRYFEFLDTSEQTALEAVRAYQDVLRYRQMVRLAEDSYVQHKYAYDQILSRVKAGVARGVDLEQAGARLALADSNRITEIANLHDVSERYRRLVGEAPPDLMPPASGLERGLPASHAQIIEQAGMRSATVAARGGEPSGRAVPGQVARGRLPAQGGGPGARWRGSQLRRHPGPEARHLGRCLPDLEPVSTAAQTRPECARPRTW